jgi:ubiquinone/menaquinone biosynthesis C-methylase UbiE
MCAQPGSNAYFNVPDAYDNFMGRYSRPLAHQFIATIPLKPGDRVLDLGCGPGALTAPLVELLGSESVTGVDPSQPFVEAYQQRFQGVTAKVGSAEDIPFEDHAFDAVMSQLVIHFVADLDSAGREMVRVTKPGGWIAACTWVFDQMELLYLFDEAAKEVTGEASPSPPAHEFRQAGSIEGYFTSIGLTDVSESTLRVSTTYPHFDDLWNTYLAGIGPLGAWMKSQPDDVKSALHAHIYRILGEPQGEITLNAAARSARGKVTLSEGSA